MAFKDLHSLIRLRKWDVDEKQRALGQLLRREETILDNLAALEAEKRREAEFVGKADPVKGLTFAAYLQRCDQRKDVMNSLLAELQRSIEEARDELGESYRRLKTFEVTQEKRDLEEAKEEDRREQIELDEIGLTLHRRKALV